MATYWNTFIIDIDNKSSSDLTWGTCDPLTGTLLAGNNVPKGKKVESACVVRSGNASLAGAAGTAEWSTWDDVKLRVVFSAPNSGDPSGVPGLTGANHTRYGFSKTLGDCEGSGCPVGSGYRQWRLTVTFTDS